MDFLFDNFQILLVLGLALAAWLKNRGEAREEEANERRAREEMIRQLEQVETRPVRRPGNVASWDTRPDPVIQAPPPIPVPHAQPQPDLWQEPEPAKTARQADPSPWSRPDDPVMPWAIHDDEAQQQLLLSQQAMQEQLAEVKKASRKARHELGGARATQRRLEHREAKSATAMPGLRSLLADPQQTRRAVLLREILGPPVGMRP